MELELGWGAARLPSSNTLDKLSEGRKAETETLERFVQLCDRYDIQVSFDVVGHLLHSSCQANHGCPFPSHFGVDPGTDATRDPLYYAPDLIDTIQSAEVNHELCTHTFSHINCSEVSPELLAWELDTVHEAHRKSGISEPTSLVPPWHAPPPRHVVSEAGIQTLRVPLPSYERPEERLKLYRWILSKSMPTGVPRLVDGVLEAYCTPHPSLTAQHLPTGQLPPSPVFRAIPTAVRQLIHKRYLESGLRQAAETGENVHYWTHLFNLSNDAQWPPVASFLKSLAASRDRGRVVVNTMASLDPGS